MVHSYLKITVSGDDGDFFLDTYVKNLKEKNFINDNFMYHYNVHFSPSIHMIL